jgi:hypothetical protein
MLYDFIPVLYGLIPLGSPSPLGEEAGFRGVVYRKERGGVIPEFFYRGSKDGVDNRE